jgi:hypothetical protein
MKRKHINPWLQVSVTGALALAGCSHSSSQQVASKPVREQPLHVVKLEAEQPAFPMTEVAPRMIPAETTIELATPTGSPMVQTSMPVRENQPSMPVQTPALASGDSGIQLASYREDAPQAAPAPQTKTVFPRGETTPARRAVVDLTASSQFGHAEDYSWVRGQVEYSRLSQGWRLRYASVDETDPHGGSVTLTGECNLHGLKDGQYIRVQGHFSNPDDKGLAPAYFADRYEVIDSAK